MADASQSLEHHDDDDDDDDDVKKMGKAGSSNSMKTLNSKDSVAGCGNPAKM